MDKLKYIKLENEDGSYSDSIPLAVDGNYVDIDGDSVQLKLNKKPYYYNNVADMKADTKLKVGDMAITLGYYSANDGGNGEYRIVNGTYTDDGGSYHKLNNNLYAELIIKENTIYIKQFGAIGDNETDNLKYFKNAINYIDGKYMNLYINAGRYFLSDKIEIKWNIPNFWSNPFRGSYGLKGAGIFESILRFEGKDGVLIYRDSGSMSIEISNFSIQNTSFNPGAQTGGERKPDLDKGVGLLYNGGGYTGKISRIGIKGFYIGLATRHCYGGPIIENVFVHDTVFGYSSKDDTTVEHHSCNYHGLEACYIQEGSKADLTNIICEGNFAPFKANANNERDKFEGRGFVFFNALANLIGCYTEDLWGNARYIEDCRYFEINGIPNSMMNWKKTRPGNEEISEWLDNHTHNYDDVYIAISDSSLPFVKFQGGNYASVFTAYVNDLTNTNTTSDDVMSNVIFEGVSTEGGASATYNRFYKGNAKPIIIVNNNASIGNRSNYSYAPAETVGRPKFLNEEYTTNYNGIVSFTTGRKSASFSDGTYDKVDLEITHDLGGNIHFYKKTSLDGTDVNRVEVIRISNTGQVSFPSNS